MRCCLPPAAPSRVTGGCALWPPDNSVRGSIFSLAPVHIKKWTSQAMSCLPARSPLQILLPHIRDADSASGALLKSEAGCDTITPSAAPGGRRAGGSKAGWAPHPRGRSCRVSPTRPSRAHQSAHKWYPSRRNPLVEILLCVPLICHDPETLGRATRGLSAAAAADGRHPPPSTQHPAQTADAVIPSWFSEANANCFLSLSSFCASLRRLSSRCAQPAQDVKQDYCHTLYQEYVYKGLINY